MTATSLLNAQIMLEVLMTGHLVAWPLHRRPHYWLRLVLSGGACLLVMGSLPISDDFSIGVDLSHMMFVGTAAYSLTALLLYGALRCCYEDSRSAMMFCAVAGYTIQHLLSAFNSVFSYSGFYERFPQLETPTYLLLIAGISIGCYATLCRGIRKLGTIIVENRTLVAVAFVAVLADIMVGLYVFFLNIHTPHQRYLTLVSVYDAAVCVFLLYTVFELALNRSLRIENQMMARLLDEQRKRYEISTHAIESVNLKCHDLKHQIHQFANRFDTGDTTLISDLERTVSDYDSMVNTGCDALDVILEEKRATYRECGIELACMADGDALNALPPNDVYALFGNILDNAIEAQTHVPEEDGRYIVITVRSVGKMLIIHEENRMSGHLHYENGLPRTTKNNDAMNHGFGTKSIRHIVTEHGGTLAMEDRDGWFVLDIAIPLP